MNKKSIPRHSNASFCKKKIKVVILCGGLGTRLKEETEFKPKPLVDIGDKPILWHIMKIYAHYGFKDFILCLGYKGEMIKEYFLRYEAISSDFTIRLGLKKEIQYHSSHAESDWLVTLVDTGNDSMTGARIKKIERYIDSDTFMLTYGDGVGDINIADLYKFHLSRGAVATVTGVRPPSRFGELIIKEGKLEKFSEKPQIHEGFINGGFFVLNRRVFRYLNNNKNCTFEQEPLETLAKENQLEVYRHDGFWHCMDNQRDMQILQGEWNKRKPAWKVWTR